MTGGIYAEKLVLVVDITGDISSGNLNALLRGENGDPCFNAKIIRGSLLELK